VRDVFDIYTIIFLALAVFIFLRLRSVLGQRTGRERPPYDPFSGRDPVRTPSKDKVVALPSRNPEAAVSPPEGEVARASRWQGVAEPGSPLAAGLDAIAGADPSFDANSFVGI
jgi:predicted lipid-binding transport protein (Tim44 family)